MGGMDGRFGLLAAALALLSGVARPGVEEFRESVRALRRTELKRLEILLTPDLLRAVRIERISEIQTFLRHIEEAPVRSVLVLGEPAPAVARVVVEPLKGEDFVLELTARAFRSLGEGGQAFVFQSPALLQWIEDRLEAPHYDLREQQEPDLATLRERFARSTRGLTREAQPGTAEEAPPAGPMPLNGDFEKEAKQRGSPLGWDRVDNLTTFWVKDPFPGPGGRPQGRVLKMDTDVLESEWLRRKEELRKDPDARPWTKTLVEPSRQYATVGATYGVSCYSAAMPVVKGRAYRITLDFRACAPDGGISKLWVRGYGRREVRGKPEWRRIYDSLHTLRTDDPTWHTYTNVFHPTKNTPRVERMRVMLYSYWPRGEYRWDNVVIVPIDDEEYREAKRTERSDIK